MAIGLHLGSLLRKFQYDAEIHAIHSNRLHSCASPAADSDEHLHADHGCRPDSQQLAGLDQVRQGQL